MTIIVCEVRYIRKTNTTYSLIPGFYILYKYIERGGWRVGKEGRTGKEEGGSVPRTNLLTCVIYLKKTSINHYCA